MSQQSKPPKPSRANRDQWRTVQAPRPSATYPPRRAALESEARRAISADELGQVVANILKLEN